MENITGFSQELLISFIRISFGFEKRNITAKNWTRGLCPWIFLAKRAVDLQRVNSYCLKLSTASCATASARYPLPQASSTGWKWFFIIIIAQKIHVQRYQAQGNRVEASKRCLWEKGRKIKVEGERRDAERAKYTRTVWLLALLFLDALKSKKQRKNSPEAVFFFQFWIFLKKV